MNLISRNNSVTVDNSVTVRKKTASAKRPDGEKKNESPKRSLTPPKRLAQKFGMRNKKDKKELLKENFEKFELKQQFLETTEVSVNSDETTATETLKNPSSLVVSPPRLSPSEENSASLVSPSRRSYSGETSGSNNDT